jgi:hypothetical protein
MPDDAVQLYCRSIGFEPSRRTALTEGTSDANLFRLARDLEFAKSGIDLYGDDFTIAAAGKGNDGGTAGILRELSRLKGISRIVLSQEGRQIYRFIGIFDNDAAGRHAARTSNALNTDIFEYRDVYRLRPIMPMTRNYDIQAMKSLFESQNVQYEKLDWECEDLLSSSLVEAFLSEQPSALRSCIKVSGLEHREWTGDGKTRLHRYVSQYAIHEDLAAVIDVIRCLRSLLGLPGL